MGKTKKGGYIEKLLKKADKALQEGVKKADEVLDNAVELGIVTAKQASKTSKELRNKAKNERLAYPSDLNFLIASFTISSCSFADVSIGSSVA